jgi:HD-like signal output (HDOD) protein
MSVANAEKIVKQIKDLPPMPLVVRKLLSVVDDGGSSAMDVGNVLSMDQALTSKVLKLVNSAFYGLPRQVPTITRAVVILGYAAVRNLVMAFASFDALKRLGSPKDQERFWEHALTVAVGAQSIAAAMKYPEPEEAFIAGLLHDIGHLIMETAIADEYKQAYPVYGSNALNLEKEEKLVGMMHTDAGTRLLEQWQLPEQLCRVSRFHHSPKVASPGKEPLISIIMLADMISSIKGASFAEEEDTETFLRISREAGFSVGEYGKVIGRMDEKIREAKSLLQVGLTAKTDAGPPPVETRIVVFIGADENRIQWVRGVLSAFGHSVLIPKLPEIDDKLKSANAVIIDPIGMQMEALAQFRMKLKEFKLPMATLAVNGAGMPDDVAKLISDLPAIPFFFALTDLNKLFKEDISDAG